MILPFITKIKFVYPTDDWSSPFYLLFVFSNMLQSKIPISKHKLLYLYLEVIIFVTKSAPLFDIKSSSI